MKKLLLTLGMTTAAIAPLATVIACGETKVETPTNPDNGEQPGTPDNGEQPGTPDNGESPGTPTPEVSIEFWDGITFDVSVEMLSNNGANLGEVQSEFKISNFDKTQLEGLTLAEETLVAFQIMKRITSIVKSNYNNGNNKNIVEFGVNGVRIDDMLTDEDSYWYDKTLYDVVYESNVFRGGETSIISGWSAFIASEKNREIANNITPEIIIFARTFYPKFAQALGLQANENLFDENIFLDSPIFEQDGEKLKIDAAVLGLVENATSIADNDYSIYSYIGMGEYLFHNLANLDQAKLDLIKTIEFDANGTTKEITINDVLGVETLSSIVHNTDTDATVASVDHSNSEWDSYFNLFTIFNPDEGDDTIEESIENFRTGDLSEEYVASTLLLKLLVEYSNQ